LASQRLVDDAQFTASLCAGRIRWVVGKPDQVPTHAFLRAAPVVAAQGAFVLWHADIADPHLRAALACAAPR
jgi:hypothetical protein